MNLSAKINDTYVNKTIKVVPEANLDLFTSSLWIQNWMKDLSDCLKILRCDKSLCIKKKKNIFILVSFVEFVECEEF